MTASLFQYYTQSLLTASLKRNIARSNKNKYRQILRTCLWCKNYQSGHLFLSIEQFSSLIGRMLYDVT